MPELRVYPRIPARLDAELTNGAGEVRTAMVGNLSLGGVMLTGDPALNRHVCDYAGRDRMRDTVEARLNCRFPDEARPFACRCRLIYIHRQSQQAFEFGFRFVDLDDDHAEMLRRFIRRAAPHATPSTARNVGGAG
jgi:hypothetical protein